MRAVFGFDADLPYPLRIDAVTGHGVALWDVVHSCRRAGSMDAKIDRKSLVVNDFRPLLSRHQGIEAVRPIRDRQPDGVHQGGEPKLNARHPSPCRGRTLRDRDKPLPQRGRCAKRWRSVIHDMLGHMAREVPSLIGNE